MTAEISIHFVNSLERRKRINPVIALTVGSAVGFVQAIREGNQQNKGTDNQGNFFNGRGDAAKPARSERVGIFPNRVGQGGQGQGKVGVDIGKVGGIQGADRKTTDEKTQGGDNVKQESGKATK